MFFLLSRFGDHLSRGKFTGFHLDSFTSSHVFGLRRVFEDEGCETVFAVEIANEGTRVALSCDFVAGHCHVHFWKFAFGTEDVLVNEFVKYFSEFLFGEVAIDDIVSVVFAAGFLEGGLGGFFGAEPLEDVLGVGSQISGDISQVDDIGLDTVALAFDFELHLGHTVTILRVLNCRRNVQHLKLCILVYYSHQTTSFSPNIYLTLEHHLSATCLVLSCL